MAVSPFHLSISKPRAMALSHCIFRYFTKHAPRWRTKMAHKPPQQCVLLNELFDRGFKRKQNGGKTYPEDRRITPNHRRSNLVEEIFV
jgi:hypothetical protein